jgi:solute carrier family 25 protein 42
MVEQPANGNDKNSHDVVYRRNNSNIQRYATQEYIMTLPKELRNLIAGGLAGMVAKSVVAPIDRIKILYQVSSRKFRIVDVPQIAYKIFTEEGLGALWKGNTATMIRVFPYSGIQFMVFDRCKTFFLHKHEVDYRATGEKREWGLTPLESLAGGSLAGVCSALCTYPLDMTRAQLAVLKRKKNAPHVGFVGILGKNYKERGVKGLFRGITPTMLGILPYAGIAFTLNEQSKLKVRKLTGREPTTVEKMQCGALSGLFAQTLTYPLEVTRRRMQTMGVAQSKDGAVGSLGMGHAAAQQTELSMLRTISEVYAEQGMAGLFKGVTLNWLKGPVAFSISFTAFDTIQGFLATDAEKKWRQPSNRRFSRRQTPHSPR